MTKKPMALWLKVFIGLALGVVAGLILGEDSAYLKWIGDIFINLLLMGVVPLVFFSILSGIISLGDPKTLGRMGIKALFGYIATTVVAITIAFLVTDLLEPGSGLDASILDQFQGSVDPAVANAEKPTIADILLGIVPRNVITAMAQGNILQVICFAVFVGVAMVLMGEKCAKATAMVHEVANIFYRMVEIVIGFAPYAVFALTAWVIGVFGSQAVESLGMLMVTVIGACLVQYALMLAIVATVGRLSPWPFMKKAINFQLIAFSTSSSSATIPTTLHTVEDKMGVSNPTASMVVPLGATVNMNGTAIYLAAATVFTAQLMGQALGFTDYLTIALTITLLSIGTAAIPSASLVMMPIVFGAVGLPVAAVGLIFGVDRFLDMVRTTINVTGDAVVSVLVDKSEGRLNKDIYNSDYKESDHQIK